MNTAENNQRLIAVMRQYFALKARNLRAERYRLKTHAKRQGNVGEFCHVRNDSEYAPQIIRTVVEGDGRFDGSRGRLGAEKGDRSQPTGE